MVASAFAVAEEGKQQPAAQAVYVINAGDHGHGSDSSETGSFRLVLNKTHTAVDVYVNDALSQSLPLSNLGKITIPACNDTLTLDESGGVICVPQGIVFNGSGGNNRLILSGANSDAAATSGSLIVEPTSIGAGRITSTNAQRATVTFTGVISLTLAAPTGKGDLIEIKGTRGDDRFEYRVGSKPGEGIVEGTMDQKNATGKGPFSLAPITITGMSSEHQLVINSGATMGNIMPLGDSITYGNAFGKFNPAVPGGYRTQLYKDLTAVGHTFRFVGTETANPSPELTAAGQVHHEGHGGWLIGPINAELDNYLKAIPSPDYVLLLLGTNDFGPNGHDFKQAIDRFDALITHITRARPNARLIVSNILFRDDNPTANEQIEAFFNPKVPELVEKHAAKGEKVSFIDLRTVIKASDLADHLHPDPTGYNKMGHAWFEAIQSFAPTSGGADSFVFHGGAANDHIKAAAATGSAITLVDTVGQNITANLRVVGVKSFNVEGDDGDDLLTIDNTTAPVTIPLNYDGGPGTNSLTLHGGATLVDTYTPHRAPGVGTLSLQFPAGTETVACTNVASMLDTTDGSLTINGTPGDDTIAYTQGSSETNGRVTVNKAPAIEFSGKMTLSINGRDGKDTISLQNTTTPKGLTNITVNGATEPAPPDGSLLWLDASILNLAEGSPVGSLDDRSGHRNNAKAYDPKSPATFNPQGLGGRGTICFFGGKQGLQTQSNFGIKGNTSRSVFAVMRKNDPAKGRMIVHSGDTSYLAGFGIDDKPNEIYAPYNWAPGGVSAAARPAGVFEIYRILYDSETKTNRGYINGKLIGNASTENLATADRPLQIGYRSGDDAASFGDFAEILAYDRLLSDAEQQGVEDYLKTKWFGAKPGAGTATLNLTCPAGAPGHMTITPTNRGFGTVSFAGATQPHISFAGIKAINLIGQSANADTFRIAGTPGGTDRIEPSNSSRTTTGTMDQTNVTGHGPYPLVPINFSGLGRQETRPR